MAQPCSGFNLLSGRRIPSLELASASKLASGKIPPPDPCPTLSADGDRLYVRVGPGVIKSVKGKEDEETAIACIRIVSNADGTCRLKEMWRIKPPRAGGRESLDVGRRAPGFRPAHVGRIRALRRWSHCPCCRVLRSERCIVGARSALMDDGHLRWTDRRRRGAPRHELLTLAGRHIVFCSNTGAVIALDAATGRRAWGFRYPRSRQTDAAQSPHPTPVVSSAGRLFVSPADGDAVYALDPESGRVLWQSGPMTGARILGVSAGRVIVTVEGLVRDSRSVRGDWFVPASGGVDSPRFGRRPRIRSGAGGRRHHRLADAIRTVVPSIG